MSEGASRWDSPHKVILDHADTLRSRGAVRHLIGNVRVRYGGKTIFADEANYNSKTGLLDLLGSVALREPDQVLTAHRVSFYENTGDYESTGDVDFTRLDSIRIRCNMARFIETEGTLDLYDNVIINNLSDGAVITGSTGRWEENTAKAVVEGNSVYRLPDPDADPPDTLVIKSRRISFDQSENSALFTGNVDLVMGELLAVSDSLYHQPDTRQTVLSGAPVIWRGSDQLSGRKVFLYFKEKELESIKVRGDAIVLSEAHPGSSWRNRLSGRELIVTIINDSTRHVHVEGDAEGEYYVWDENDVYQGVNLSAADVIELLIESNKATEIKLMGKTTGAFHPPGMEPLGVADENPGASSR